MCNALSVNSILISLEIATCQLKGWTFSYLATVLKSPKTKIARLNLRNNEISGGIPAFAPHLPECLSLTSIELSNNQIQSEDFSLFAQTLGNLLTLIVDHNHLSAKACSGFEIGLQSNMKLVFLDLDTNEIDGQAAELLANGLVKNMGLERFNISNNKIKDQGFIAIAKALLKHPKIKMIGADSIDCTDKSLDAAVETISNIPTLVE